MRGIEYGMLTKLVSQLRKNQKKNVAEKGKKRSTSGERWTTVTMVFAVNAIGNSLPPMLIFPRVNFKQHFLSNGPSGCIGASHPSGLVPASSFFKVCSEFT